MRENIQMGNTLSRSLSLSLPFCLSVCVSVSVCLSVSLPLSLCARACTSIVNHSDARACNCYNNQYRKTRRIRRRRRTADFVHNWLYVGFTCVVLTSAQPREAEKQTIILPKHTVLLRPLQCGPVLCSGRAARRPARCVKRESCHPTTTRTQDAQPGQQHEQQTFTAGR